MTPSARGRSELSVVVPGNLETRTGGYAYDRRIIGGLRAAGWTVAVHSLDASFPFPTSAARAQAASMFDAIPDGRLVLADGLALGALPDEIAPHAARLTIVALVHHPLALETGLTPDRAAALEASERRALASARAVVVTSRATAAALARYGVPPDRVSIVEPGTDPAPVARSTIDADRSRADEATLLCVATITPRKGHELLLDALASAPRPWRLRCAGSADRDERTTARVRDRIRAHGFDARVDLLGDLDAARLAVEYDHADLFVLATFYEGYGMAVAEALARGLPVVATATGAIADLVGRDAGIVVPPGDAGALASALDAVLGDAELRARLAAGARRVRVRLPTWEHAALGMAGALARARELAHG